MARQADQFNTTGSPEGARRECWMAPSNCKRISGFWTGGEGQRQVDLIQPGEARRNARILDGVRVHRHTIQQDGQIRAGNQGSRGAGQLETIRRAVLVWPRPVAQRLTISPGLAGDDGVSTDPSARVATAFVEVELEEARRGRDQRQWNDRPTQAIDIYLNGDRPRQQIRRNQEIDLRRRNIIQGRGRIVDQYRGFAGASQHDGKHAALHIALA